MAFLGVVQGRLTTSPNQLLQFFPQDSWREEFPLAASLGFQYIEMFVEREHNDKNPMWSEEGLADIRTLSEHSGLQRYSVCNDYVIDHDLRTDASALRESLSLVRQAGSLGVRLLILPLFEKSEVSRGNYEQFLRPLRQVAQAAREYGITVCLETLLNGGELRELLGELEEPNVAVCFDTGNRAALGQDLAGDIRLLGSAIKHVHIKDKDKDGNNVLLGTGSVNFDTVMRSLAAIGYAGAFTLETYRGRNPVETSKYHLTLVRFFIHEHALGRS